VTEAFRLREAGLVPEGIARDGTSRAFFVGSIKKRKIVRFLDGKIDDFVPTARGFHAFLGLRVDEARRVLWAASVSDKEEADFKPADEGRAELVAFDLATGATKARYPTPGGEKHLLNDVALAADGTAFVTDSEIGAVWALAPGEKALRVLAPAGRFVYPNGIAYDDAAGALFVSDTLGLWRVDPNSGNATPLPFSAGAALEGIDGLYLNGDWLIGVQNVVGAGRAVAWRLDPPHARIVARKVLVSAHPAFVVPTTGAVVGNLFYLLANSTINGARRDEAPIVLQVPLPA
jgi:sugar lactone lactonase YvrE